MIYCIEPLAPRETALINTVAEAAEVVRAIDSPALRTMIDCSAAGATEAAVGARADRPLAADRPRRATSRSTTRTGARPGQGDDGFAPIFAALARHGYAGDGRRRAVRLRPRRPRRAAFAAGYLRGVRESLA